MSKTAMMFGLCCLVNFSCSGDDADNAGGKKLAGNDATRQIYSVQIAALQDTVNIARLLAQLRAAGQTVMISPIETSETRTLRIAVGPFSHRDRASEALASVRALGFSEAFVKAEEIALEPEPEESNPAITKQKVVDALERIESYIENVTFSSDSIVTDSLRNSGVKQLTEIGSCSQPRWSPSGREIAFLHNSGQANGLFTVGTGGGRISRIVEKDERFDITAEYVWSPDGNKIALVARETNDKYEKVDNLYIVNKDGSGLRSILKQDRSLFRIRNLKWSPDARHVAFQVFFGRTDENSDIVQQVRALSVADGQAPVDFDEIANLRKTQWLLGWRSHENLLYLSSIDRAYFGGSFDYEVREFDITEGADVATSPRVFVSNCVSSQIIQSGKQIVYSAFTDPISRAPSSVVQVDVASGEESAVYTSVSPGAPLSELNTSPDGDIFFFHDDQLRVFNGQGQKAMMDVHYSPQYFTVSPTGTRLCYAQDGNIYLLRVPLQ